MIRIDRSASACPESLATEGERDLGRLRPLVPQGLKSKDFRKSIFGSDEVKLCLWKMQHRKCCYCEREYEQSHSDVEHFRPKAEAVRSGGIKDAGYWWLAYRFENLYFSCPICNRSKKKSHFPLRGGARPLVAEEYPWEVAEEALLIDPGFDHPEKHLTFEWLPGDRGPQIAPRDGSERGKKTIEILKLDRDDLFEIRRKYYVNVLQPVLQRFVDAKTPQETEKIRAEARALAAADTPFALLARVALRALLEPPEP
jgi:uncharacterized protein (TIGR02646 family)